MAQIINTNLPSLNAQRNLGATQNSLATSLERLSTGLRINSAKDDAAGLAISERFTTQIRGLNQAVRNANDGISFSQVAEGALGTIGDALQRIRELSIQAINDTNSASDRQALNNEVSQLIAEVNRVASSTQFNGQNILDGTLGDLIFQVGANQNQTISVTGVDVRGSQLGARLSESGSFTQTTLDAVIAAPDLLINGNAIDLSGLEAGDSIEAVIRAINAQQASTGVQALKATTTNTGDIAASLSVPAAPDNGVITINNVQVTVVNDGAGAVDFAATIANINAVSAQTGVSADDSAPAVILNNESGQEIVLGGANYAAGTPETFYAGITLASEVQDVDFVVDTTLLAPVTGGEVLGGGQTNQTFSEINVLTGENANDAILTLDFALQQVNGLRAELGAVQTRFESTISNLSVTAENLTASRSRIQDADFAAETANLTRAQILQQAGTSVLAQANAIPQNVLTLLG